MALGALGKLNAVQQFEVAHGIADFTSSLKDFLKKFAETKTVRRCFAYMTCVIDFCFETSISDRNCRGHSGFLG